MTVVPNCVVESLSVHCEIFKNPCELLCQQHFGSPAAHGACGIKFHFKTIIEFRSQEASGVAMDSKTVESKVEPVSSQFGLGYITSYKSNLESLKTEVQKLEATKNSVRDSVDEATKNGEVIVNVVEIWLKKVDATVAEANKLIIESDAPAQQEIPEDDTKIYQVLEEGNFDRISYSKPSTLKEIQQALKDPNIFRIGLYGTDGVGKTTLVKELAREVEKEKMGHLML
ncbi:hypothetical protein JHK87_037292 [Glycine soja]|nr:hypothetical protein JHK87_037292 [Glycine soja]